MFSLIEAASVGKNSQRKRFKWVVASWDEKRIGRKLYLCILKFRRIKFSTDEFSAKEATSGTSPVNPENGPVI